MAPKQRGKKQAPSSPRATAPVTTRNAPPPRPPTARQEEEKTSPLIMLYLLPMVLLIASLSLTFHLYQKTLEPLYGAVPTTYHVDKFIWPAVLLGAFAPSPSIWTCIGIYGTLLSAMPLSAYWVAVYTARQGNPVMGPVITHGVVLLPIIYAGMAVVNKMVVCASVIYSMQRDGCVGIQWK